MTLSGVSTASRRGGSYHTMIRLQNGTVLRFAQQHKGQVGNNTSTNWPDALCRVVLSGVSSIAGGRSSSYALSKCRIFSSVRLGKNDLWQVRSSTTNDVLVPPCTTGSSWRAPPVFEVSVPLAKVARAGCLCCVGSGREVWAWAISVRQLGDDGGGRQGRCSLSSKGYRYFRRRGFQRGSDGGRHGARMGPQQYGQLGLVDDDGWNEPTQIAA